MSLHGVRHARRDSAPPGWPLMRDTHVAYLHPNEVSASFQQSFNDLTLDDLTSPDGVIGDVTRSTQATGGIPDGRNDAVEAFLTGDLEWLFFIDADMGFQRDVITQLRAAADPDERPVVGGLCFQWKEAGSDGMSGFHCEPRPTIYDWQLFPDGYHRYTARRTYPIAHIIPVSATGAACLLIHRSVLEQMGDEYGRSWFTRTLGEDGTLLGEDISFFDRCRRLGVPVHVNTGVRTSHAKATWVSEWDYWSRAQAPAATARVDVIVPVLHRPQNVRPFMDSLRASTGLATAWFVCDPGDGGEISEVLACGGRVVLHAGTFAEKVNHTYPTLGQDPVYPTPANPAPWIFLCGDDVLFTPGWLDHAQAVGNQYQAGVVGTNDLGNPAVMAGTHATHMLIRRSYIDEHGATFDAGPGVVCGPYRHCFVDNEIVVAAMKRNVWQMALGSVVEHMHPYWGKADKDNVYELGQSFYKDDEALFQRRAHRFFTGTEVAA